MNKKTVVVFFVSILFVTSLFSQQASPAKPVTIAQKVAGMQKLPGFFNLYWSSQEGKLWLEIGRWDEEFLFADSLPQGVGSNDIGLDRGQIGDSRVAKFERIGPKVLLMQPNYSYRAITDDAAEKRAVEESFAQSVLWGFTVAAEEDSRVLVDATDFFLSDIHRVAGVLRDTEQGDYSLDVSRSALYLPRTKNFPLNTEVESTLTFLGEKPGRYVQQVVPSPRSVTVREHFSFVQLPDSGYKPREFDPRSGYSSVDFADYAAPLGDSIHKRLIIRHRLQKKDPNAAMSEPVKPIVYYVDPGTPEPVRSALVEGASWWNQAFEAIGYRNAFQVKLLPPDADPMDVRYNVVQWVHRATRGWSLGGAVYDPRTGEIIQGHVTLGSQRVRQDYLIAEGLLSPYESGKAVSPEMKEMALARIRQLSAHEVGHSIGLGHNFAASTQGRASVMDYPQPLVTIRDDGSLDLSNAYAKGIGEWDKVTIAYGYTEIPAATDEKQQLNSILEQAAARGLYFITDEDARPAGSANPYSHLWDNGPNPIDEMDHILKVRSAALQHFSENNIQPGAPMATLEDVLVPIYLYHRYQVEAVAKMLGGADYRYALRGDGQIVTNTVDPERQRAALRSLLQTLQPEFLTIPPKILDLIPPRPADYQRDRELFDIRTGLTFDPQSAAESAASITVSMILQPERAARLIDFHSRDSKNPGLDEVIDRLFDATWKAAPGKGSLGEIHRTVDHVVLENLMDLAIGEKNMPQVKAIALLKLEELRRWLSQRESSAHDEDERAHEFFAATQIKNFLADPQKRIKTTPTTPPAGAPIGSYEE